MRKSSVPLCGTELFFTVSLVPPVWQTQPPPEGCRLLLYRQ